MNALQNNSQYSDVLVQAPRPLTFRSTDRAADIEFTETNADGVPRHAVERIWSENGQTYIIQLNTPAADWSRLSSIFGTMTRTCTVTG